MGDMTSDVTRTYTIAWETTTIVTYRKTVDAAKMAELLNLTVAELDSIDDDGSAIQSIQMESDLTDRLAGLEADGGQTSTDREVVSVGVHTEPVGILPAPPEVFAVLPVFNSDSEVDHFIAVIRPSWNAVTGWYMVVRTDDPAVRTWELSYGQTHGLTNAVAKARMEAWDR